MLLGLPEVLHVFSIFSVDTLLLLFDTVCLFFSLASDFVMHLLEVLTNVEV